MDVEQLAAIAVDSGLKVHQAIGPGLLESAYEAILANVLMRRGLSVERQKLIAFVSTALSSTMAFAPIC